MGNDTFHSAAPVVIVTSVTDAGKDGRGPIPGGRMSGSDIKPRRTFADLTEFLHFGPTQVLWRIQLLAPKKRKAQVRWILALAILGVAATLALDTSVREFVVSRARPVVARLRASGGAAAAAPAADALPSASPKAETSAPAANAVPQTVASPSVSTPSDPAPSPSPGASATKTAAPHSSMPTPRPARKKGH